MERDGLLAAYFNLTPFTIAVVTPHIVICLVIAEPQVRPVHQFCHNSDMFFSVILKFESKITKKTIISCVFVREISLFHEK